MVRIFYRYAGMQVEYWVMLAENFALHYPVSTNRDLILFCIFFVPCCSGPCALHSSNKTLLHWRRSKKWKLPFHPSKCTILHLGSRNAQADYTIEGEQLEKVDVKKDLGVRIDQQLKFKVQAGVAVGKANRIL